MKIPVEDEKDSGPFLFGNKVESPAVGLICSCFKGQGADTYKVSAGSAVGAQIILTTSSVMEHNNCSPAETFLLRSSDYKQAMDPDKIKEFIQSNKKIKLSSDLVNAKQGVALLRLPEDTTNPKVFGLHHVTLGDIFKEDSLVKDIKVVGYNKAEALHSALVYEEKKGFQGQKNEEVFKIRDKASSTLEFHFDIKIASLEGNPVTAKGKVFAIVTGDNGVRLISEGLHMFIEKDSLKAK